MSDENASQESKPKVTKAKSSAADFRSSLPTTFKQQLQDLFGEVGRELGASANELAEYMAQRTEHLSLITHESTFADAVLAERDAIALKAGIIATRDADIADQRILGTIAGAIRIAATALA